MWNTSNLRRSRTSKALSSGRRAKLAGGRDAFLKSVESQKTHHDVLSKKFDEMLKIAKENPDEPPPKRDIDFD